MVVRLQGRQSSAWMAPYALAAQLRAQTSLAPGITALGAGLERGIGAHVENVQRREDIARNEEHFSRLQGRLEKQDEVDLLKTKLQAISMLRTGLGKQIKDQIDSGMKPDPSLLQRLQEAESGGTSILSQLLTRGSAATAAGQADCGPGG